MNGESNPEISAVRNQVVILTLFTIVIGMTMAGYFYMQSRTLGRELDANQKLVDNFTAGQPALATFVNQLGAYSMSHPDIKPILAKYGIVSAPTQPGLSTPTQVGPSGGVPLAAPAVAPKK